MVNKSVFVVGAFTDGAFDAVLPVDMGVFESYNLAHKGCNLLLQN